jgi:hypothetical protein
VSTDTNVATPSQAVAEVLQGYARRGVFQDCQQVAGKQGKTAFHFGWVYHQPYTLVCDAPQHKLVFADLLPRIENNSMMHREIKAFLKGRSDPSLPAHRRIDPEQMTLKSRWRQQILSLELTLVDGDYAHATTRLVNLVHELFLFLHEHWADYMWENFDPTLE